MIYLGFLLHLYQPWWQERKIIQKISEECYEPLMNLLNSYDQKLITLNIQWALVEKLKECGKQDIIERIKKAVATNKIELLKTAAYHPILPLISPEMAESQIECDNEMKKTEGILANSPGFFLPELAYDKNLIPVLKNFGAKWTVTDDVSYHTRYRKVPFDEIISQDGIAIFLRSNLWSNLIAMNKISWQEFKSRFPKEVYHWTKGKDCYVILVMDGETFGHHHKKSLANFLKPLLDKFSSNNGGVKLVSLGEIFSGFPKFQGEVPPGSWATSPEDFVKQDYFPLWRSPRNTLHQIMWKISELAVSCLDKNVEHDLEVLKCQTSCQFWWVTGDRWQPDLSLKDIKHSINIVLQRGDENKRRMVRKYQKELLEKIKATQ